MSNGCLVLLELANLLETLAALANKWLPAWVNSQVAQHVAHLIELLCAPSFHALVVSVEPPRFLVESACDFVRSVLANRQVLWFLRIRLWGADGCIRRNKIWKKLRLAYRQRTLLSHGLKIVRLELCRLRCWLSKELRGKISILLLRVEVCFLVCSVMCAIWYMRLWQKAEEQISAALWVGFLRSWLSGVLIWLLML